MRIPGGFLTSRAACQETSLVEIRIFRTRLISNAKIYLVTGSPIYCEKGIYFTIKA